LTLRCLWPDLRWLRLAEKPETRFKKKVVKYFDSIGAKVFVIQQLSKRGDPDLLICLNGRFIALELKRGIKQRASPLQAHILNEVLKAGGIALTMSPETFESGIEHIALLMTGDRADYDSVLYAIKQPKAC
jgi:hypothetical protein